MVRKNNQKINTRFKRRMRNKTNVNSSTKIFIDCHPQNIICPAKNESFW